MPLSTQEIISLGREYLLGNVNRQPLAFIKGQGAKLWDADGKQYLDFVAGIATCAFGHCPDFAAKVLAQQAQTLWHVSNLYWNEPLVKVAELLVQKTGLSKAFFCNSGAEANEAAIKMARKYSFDIHGPGRHEIICALNSFHGRTMGAISATGQEKLHQGFQPLLEGFTFVPFGQIEPLAAAVNKKTCAVLLEPVQGEGGIMVPPPDYLKAVAELCRQKGLLLILDEIQTGLARTGTNFAFQHFEVKPDLITLGKALGCGYPIGALVSAEEPSKALTPGSHSTTIGGAPLAMALSLELLTKLFEPSFSESVRKKGQHFLDGLKRLTVKYPNLALEARGLGLMLGLNLSQPSGPVAEDLRKKGFLVNATASTVLRFVPPLIVSSEEIDLLLSSLEKSLSEVYPDRC
ncbi:MAG: aspartate aminotransferase family protein [Deltaproteobacteria bacterium]|jgi:predicted acetylornithine/succinylornithine family transaminase|nr:aspartate aminotransferase family protein [Deltaproteobacteria bacterium]